jgi:acyl-CoA thioester hydrolase
MENNMLPRISFTGNIIFEDISKIRQSDINIGNHLGNDKVLNFITDNHSKFYINHGFRIENINGIAEIFTSTYVRYKKEVTYPDTITIGLGIYNIIGNRVYFYHVIKNKLNQICHEAIIETVYISLETKLVVDLTPTLLSIIKNNDIIHD